MVHNKSTKRNNTIVKPARSTHQPITQPLIRHLSCIIPRMIIYQKTSLSTLPLLANPTVLLRIRIEKQTIPLNISLPLHANHRILIPHEVLRPFQIWAKRTRTRCRGLIAPPFALLRSPCTPGAKVCAGGLLGGLDVCLGVGEVWRLGFPFIYD